MHLSPVPTWLPPPAAVTPHTKQRTIPYGVARTLAIGLVSCRPCIALGGVSADIAYMHNSDTGNGRPSAPCHSVFGV